MLEDFFVPMFLSLLLGALIGVQREIRQQKENKRDLGFLNIHMNHPQSQIEINNLYDKDELE